MKNIIMDYNVKNFTLYNDGDNGVEYIQYLCKFKDEVNSDSYNQFLNDVKEKGLSKKVISFFGKMVEADVIDFKDFNKEITEDNMEVMSSAANEFLDMFDYGNLRIKTSDRYSLDYMAATRALFGNYKKDRRMIREIGSAKDNTNLVNLIGYDVTKNYKDDIKGKKSNQEKEKVKRKS